MTTQPPAPVPPPDTPKPPTTAESSPAAGQPAPVLGYPPQPGGASPTGYAQPPGDQPTHAWYPAAPPSRRLTRSRHNRVLGGVCGGLARYWNTDPTLLRILTVVLTLASAGALLIGYLIAWFVLPDEPYTPGHPVDYDPVGYATGGNPAYPDTTGQYAPVEPHERSHMGWLVLSIAVLVAGVLGLVSTLVPSTVAAPAIIGAVVLTILGLGMLLGAWYGRMRWLAILAVPVALMTFGAVAASAYVQSNPNWDRWVAAGSDGQLELGDRTWVVTPADVGAAPLDFRISAGSAVLDLTGLTALPGTVPGSGQRVEIAASVGIGNLQVLLPPDLQLDLTASVDLGGINVPGQPPLSGTHLRTSTTVPPVTQGQPGYIVTLVATMGAGDLEVHHDAA